MSSHHRTDPATLLRDGVHGFVQRPRLLDRIDEALDAGCPVVVAGPAGSGVSTLLAEWAGRTARPVTGPVGAAGPGPVPRPDGWRVLVVDDAHVLDVAGVRDLLVDRRPVVLGGRAGTVLETAAEVGAVLVDGRDLAFTADEAAVVLGRTVGTDVVSALLVRAVGGVAGHVGILVEASSVVAAQERPAVDLAARFAGAVDAATVGWSRRVLAEPNLGAFAGHACVVRTVPDALSVELGLPGNVADTHLRAARAGLGFVGPDGFVWHEAVLRAVRTVGAAAEPVGRRALLQRAVAWAITHDHTVTAVDAAVQLDDLDLLSDVLTASWTRLTGPGAPAIARLLDPVRPRRAARYPVVLAAIARAESAADRHHARASRMNAAVAAAVAEALPTAPPSERVFLAAIEAQARRVSGDDRGAAAAAEIARVGLEGLDVTAADRLAPRLPFVLQQIAATELADGAREEALATLARIEPTEGADGDLQRAAAQGLAALVHALSGEVSVARRLLDEPRVLDLPTGALARAVVALEDGDPDTAASLLTRVDPLFGAFEHWPVVLALRARTSTLAGHVPPADHLAAHDAEVLRYRLRAVEGGVGARMLGRARVRLQLAAGQLVQAAAGLDALGPVRVWNAPEHVGLALARDEPEHALSVVSAVDVRGGYEPRTGALLVLLRAAALRRTGDVDGAVAAFREAVALFDRHGMRGELLTAPRDDVRALVALSGDDRASALWRAVEHLRSVLPDPGLAVVLSERETVVLRLLALPLSVPELAAELHVSVNTVKTQVRSVYRKLGVSTRRGAVEQGRALGLIASD